MSRIRQHFNPPIAFFFLSHAFFHLSNFRFSLFFRQGTRPPYVKKPRNSCKDTPAAFLRQQRRGRGSISSAKLEKQALYAGGHKNHFLSLLSVTSLTARPQALDEALGTEGSRSNALLPAINGSILQLFATMETNSGWLICKVNNFLARHPPFSATQHLLYAQPRPSPASPYAQGSLFPLADLSKGPFQPCGSAPFFCF
jgi:hypothetical protein